MSNKHQNTLDLILDTVRLTAVQLYICLSCTLTKAAIPV